MAQIFNPKYKEVVAKIQAYTGISQLTKAALVAEELVEARDDNNDPIIDDYATIAKGIVEVYLGHEIEEDSLSKTANSESQTALTLQDDAQMPEALGRAVQILNNRGFDEEAKALLGVFSAIIEQCNRGLEGDAITSRRALEDIHDICVTGRAE